MTPTEQLQERAYILATTIRELAQELQHERVDRHLGDEPTVWSAMNRIGYIEGRLDAVLPLAEAVCKADPIENGLQPASALHDWYFQACTCGHDVTLDMEGCQVRTVHCVECGTWWTCQRTGASTVKWTSTSEEAS